MWIITASQAEFDERFAEIVNAHQDNCEDDPCSLCSEPVGHTVEAFDG